MKLYLNRWESIVAYGIIYASALVFGVAFAMGVIYGLGAIADKVTGL